ncbi:MAG: DUF4340 domain-containing protein [Treponema sp.]|nr:DUF4340 domain-containing protein [Treponema sp.]
MSYKKKLYILVSLVAVLALLYIGNIVFYSDLGARQSSFAWLDSKTAERSNRIIVSSQTGVLELVKQNGKWSVLYDDIFFPARQIRVQDFLDVLTTRSAWPVRSSSASTHERFGLDDDASRITIYGEDAVLLNLLVGDDDAMGRETYFRKEGNNEVRSGDSGIKIYTTGSIGNWFNYRLIPETEGGQLDFNSVQRMSVYTSSETQVFSRRNRTWVISGIEVANPDIPGLESYIRTVINTEADSFSDSVFHDDPLFEQSRIVVEFGNGAVYNIRLGEGDDIGRLFAHVSKGDQGEPLIYSIPAWAAYRLFKEAESFEKQ